MQSSQAFESQATNLNTLLKEQRANFRSEFREVSGEILALYEEAWVEEEYFYKVVREYQSSSI